MGIDYIYLRKQKQIQCTSTGSCYKRQGYVYFFSGQVGLIVFQLGGARSDQWICEAHVIPGILRDVQSASTGVDGHITVQMCLENPPWAPPWKHSCSSTSSLLSSSGAGSQSFQTTGADDISRGNWTSSFDRLTPAWGSRPSAAEPRTGDRRFRVVMTHLCSRRLNPAGDLSFHSLCSVREVNKPQGPDLSTHCFPYLKTQQEKQDSIIWDLFGLVAWDPCSIPCWRPESEQGCSPQATPLLRRVWTVGRHCLPHTLGIRAINHDKGKAGK